MTEPEPAPDSRPRARRRLSQNFLVDDRVAARIVAAFDPRPSDLAIEVGPGRGALTLRLAKSVQRLVAIELDAALAERLAQALLPCPGASVRHADVLAAPFSTVFPGATGVRLIANLPYGISSPFVLKALEEREALSDLTILLQREFAARVGAAPGGKDYGSLSVLVQSRFAVTSFFDVPPHAFQPRPQVWSRLVRLTPLATPVVSDADWPGLKRLLRVAFAARRKTLANALAPLVTGAAVRLAALGIDPSIRGERLPVAAWVRLLEALDFLAE